MESELFGNVLRAAVNISVLTAGVLLALCAMASVAGEQRPSGRMRR
jgi:hypothetical protein